MNGVISQMTSKLRFVEREIAWTANGDNHFRTVKVLQQFWAYQLPSNGKMGEWRDVPLEVEDD